MVESSPAHRPLHFGTLLVYGAQAVKQSSEAGASDKVWVAAERTSRGVPARQRGEMRRKRG